MLQPLLFASNRSMTYDIHDPILHATLGETD